MGVIHPGEWVGYLSCLDGLPHAYSGIARYGARTLSLAPADVARIFERDVATYRLLLAPALAAERKQIGRASCRESVGRDVEISVVRVSLKKKKKSKTQHT